MQNIRKIRITDDLTKMMTIPCGMTTLNKPISTEWDSFGDDKKPFYTIWYSDGDVFYYFIENPVKEFPEHIKAFLTLYVGGLPEHPLNFIEGTVW